MVELTFDQAKAVLKDAERALSRVPRYAPQWQYDAARSEFLIARSTVRWWGLSAANKDHLKQEGALTCPSK